VSRDLSDSASDSASAQRLNGAVGMLVFLGACAMLFAALLFAYAVMRTQAVAWPPPGTPPFPRADAGANGLLLIAAGFALRRARTRGPAWAAGALGLGALFLLMQAVLWGRLVAAHLGPGTGALGDAFFALSTFHALHVLGGLVAITALLRPRARADARPRRLRLAILYMDFVAVVWVVFYVAVCLL
jgi:heme/copper-type cytochrome/quinol oxidase subunit 3